MKGDTICIRMYKKILLDRFQRYDPERFRGLFPYIMQIWQVTFEDNKIVRLYLALYAFCCTFINIYAQFFSIKK